MVALEGLARVRWQGQPVTERRPGDRFGYMPVERGLYPKSMQILEQPERLGRLHEMTAGVRHREAARNWIGAAGPGQPGSRPSWRRSHGNQQRGAAGRRADARPGTASSSTSPSPAWPGGVDDGDRDPAERARAGVTVVFSSHQLDLVEHICESVAIIHRGRAVAQGASVVPWSAATGCGWPSGSPPTREATGPGTSWIPGSPRSSVVDAGHGALVLAPDADSQKVLDTARAAGQSSTGFATRRYPVFRDVTGEDA